MSAIVVSTIDSSIRQTFESGKDMIERDGHVW